jgi:hypothetical protein
MAVTALVMVGGIAWFTARTTVYTLTDKRVVMRIGIVLTLSLNLPLRRLEAADLKLHSGEQGDIALRLLKPDHIAYLHLWPHARAWRLARPEPTLLCLPGAQAVARRLTDAWRSLGAGGTLEAASQAATSQSPSAQSELQTSMATH